MTVTIFAVLVLVWLYGIWSVLKQILSVLQDIHRYVAWFADRAPRP